MNRETPKVAEAAAAVLDNPADYVPRLRYAAALDLVEGDRRELCRTRARFVRAQTESSIAADVCPNCNHATRAGDPGRLSDKRAKRGVPCNCLAARKLAEAERLLFHTDVIAPSEAGLWMNMTLGNWMLWELPRIKFARVESTGGFIDTVHVTLAEFMEHAGRIFAETPITAVRLTDRMPRRPHGKGNPDGWRTEPDWDVCTCLECEDVLPPELAGYVSTLADKDEPETAADSNLWLSWACVAYGRQQARLRWVEPAELLVRAHVGKGV